MQLKAFFKKLSAWLVRYFLTIFVTSLLFLSLVIFGMSLGVKEVREMKEKLMAGIDIENYVYKPALTTQIYSKNGTLLAELYDENRRYIPFSEIPQNVKDALVATEDRRFHEHHGIDPRGIMRALATNFTSGDATSQGASTITQQVARSLFLTKEKKLERKLKEMFIAFELENKYDKNKLLEIYLNEVYFGNGAYGIESASQVYFGKTSSELNFEEATLLVGLPQSPSRYNPLGKNGPDLALKRRVSVLQSMYDTGIITKEQVDESLKKEIKFFEGKVKDSQKVMNMRYPYFTSWAIEELKKQHGSKVFSSGWQIYTTIDDKAQQEIERVAAEQSSINAKNFGLNDIAMTAINPKTGELLAMSSGNNKTFQRTQINMSTRPRQPASTIKPLVYAVAMNEGLINDSTVMKDEEININGYKPKNVTGRHHGYMTARHALVTSNNIFSIKVGQKVKVGTVHKYLENMGVKTLTKEDRNVGFSIGGLTKGITPYDMARTYGVIANEGVLTETHFVSKIQNHRGDIIYAAKPNKQRILQKEVADEMTDILRDVATQGTGKTAQFGHEMAGKTGTSNNNMDMWFVGYTPDIVTSVWVGNNDNKKPTRTNNLYTSNTSNPAYSKFMKAYYNHTAKTPFPPKIPLVRKQVVVGDDDSMYMLGQYCKGSGSNLVTVMVQEKNLPKDTKNCKPTQASDIVKEGLQNGETYESLMAQGFTKELINQGHLRTMVEQGLYREIAEMGYVQELKAIGLEEQLIADGYLKKAEPVQEKPVEELDKNPTPADKPKEEPVKEEKPQNKPNPEPKPEKRPESNTPEKPEPKDEEEVGESTDSNVDSVNNN